MADFRSDTVTRPSLAMKQAMMDAPLGDDVMGDDPTVQRLEEMAAGMLGFEAALFAPSGTQTNLIALMTHCQRGDEAIVGQQWHTYRWETGGMAVLGSIQPQPVPHQTDGSLALQDIQSAIKPDDPHFAKTRLIVIENTTGGKVLSLAYMREVQQLARQHQLSIHIDGARLFNAAVALGQQVGVDPLTQAREIVQGYDSVSVCLSKGLGAPIGSVLLGSAAFIQRGRRIRKMLGGGMRQAGLLAAAGIYALQHNVQRLADDHINAQTLAEGLARLIESHPKLSGKMWVHPAHTNILFTDVDADIATDLLHHLASRNIKVTSSALQVNGRPVRHIRWVTHLDGDDVELALQAIASF